MSFYDGLLLGVEGEDACAQDELVAGLDAVGGRFQRFGFGLFVFRGGCSAEIVFFLHGFEGGICRFICHFACFQLVFGAIGLVICLLDCLEHTLTRIVIISIAVTFCTFARRMELRVDSASKIGMFNESPK